MNLDTMEGKLPLPYPMAISTLRPLRPRRAILLRKDAQLGLFGGETEVKPTAAAKRRERMLQPKAPPKPPKPSTRATAPKEGDTRINRAGNEEVLRAGRWRLASNPKVVAKDRGSAAIVPVVEADEPMLEADEDAIGPVVEEPMVESEPQNLANPGSTFTLEQDDNLIEEITDGLSRDDEAALRSGGGVPVRDADDGGTVSASDRGAYRQVEPRLITARAELTKPADTGVIPEGIRDHLRDHQQQGAAAAIAAMDKQGGFLLADGTGAGKTRQLLAIAERYRQQGKKVLIIAPSEVIKPNWKKGTVAGSFKDDSSAMGIPVSLAMQADKMGAGKICISAYSRLNAFEDAIDDDTILLFDEAHSFKNVTAQRSKIGMKMMRKAKAVCYATATPADKPEHIAYLFKAGIFNGLKQDEIFSWLGMKQREIRVGGGRTVKKWEIPRGKSAEVYQRMAGLFDNLTDKGLMIKREISMEDVDVGFETLTLPDKARVMLEAIEDNFEGGEGLERAQMLMHQRRQLEPYKIQAAVDLAKRELAEGRQVVLFISRVNESAVKKRKSSPDDPEVVLVDSEGTAKLIREALEKEGILDITELHGESETKAEAAMARFQSGEARVMIATVESGGTGVNLDDRTGEAPRTLVMVTPPFNAVQNLQAAGRVWRMTTKTAPRIRYLFTDADVDSWNRRIIANKMAAVGAAVQGEVGILDLPEDISDDAIEAFIEARDKKQDFDPMSPAPRPPEPVTPVNTNKLPPGFRVNKYGGYTRGGTYVEAGAGYIRNENGKWVTYAKSQVDEAGNVTPEPTPEKPETMPTAERLDVAKGIVSKINAMGEGETPYSPEEIKSIEYALQLIESADNDRGEERNMAGWSGSTRSDGVRLSRKVNAGQPLSASELTNAVKILQIHRRQLKDAEIDLPSYKEPTVAGLDLTPTVWQGGDRIRVYLNGPGRRSYGYFEVNASGSIKYDRGRDGTPIDSDFALGEQGRQILQEITPSALTKSLPPAPVFTLMGVPYIFDHHRAVLRKAGTSWEQFVADLSKEADGDPCWEGYEAVGMKKKRGKMVPNCVPVGR